MLQLRRHLRLQLNFVAKRQVCWKFETRESLRVTVGAGLRPALFFALHKFRRSRGVAFVAALLVNRPDRAIHPEIPQRGIEGLRLSLPQRQPAIVAQAIPPVRRAYSLPGIAFYLIDLTRRSRPAKTQASGTPADFRKDLTAAYPSKITATSSTSHRKISCVSVQGRGSTHSAFTTSGPN